MAHASTNRRLLVVAGPTATGKTRTALELARALDGELVGADSVQVYRGVDIGSAKPTPEELGGVPHHLLDVADPNETLDAGRYAALADAAIARVFARGRLPIVVGGTGLWVRALLYGLVDVPPVDPALRAALDAEAEAAGTPALHARLTAVDPVGASRIHPNDRVRVVRALEVHAQTGRALGALREAHGGGAPRYDAELVVLDLDPRLVADRIAARLDAMLARGWLEEIRALLEAYGPRVRALGAVGYRQLVPHVAGELPLADARARALKATRVYARRQRTWFRGERGVSLRATPEELLTTTAVASLAERLGRRVRRAATGSR